MINVNKIVIVGGGSSGWIAASYLIKTFPNIEIIVIESSDVPTVGVGESTLADFTEFRDYLEIDEKDFMRKTNASYKMSIKFTDFYDINSGGFHYPFGYPNLTDTNYGLIDWLEIKAFYPETPVNDFVNCYFPNSYLFENNKFATNSSGFYDPYNKTTDVAYHFDATLFGAWLRDDYCIPRGVLKIESTVIDFIENENGIDSLILQNGNKIKADLFIDCTGFKSLLLGKYLNEEFISYSDMLPNNKAWATKLKYKNKEKELEPYTNSTAIRNGWVWNIPLWSRIGTGYVYSDKYISSENALKEFKEHLCSNKMTIPRTKEEINDLEFVDISMRVGIHKRTWVKNVVAIGLSAGFIEPLESNGLFSTLKFTEKLSKTLLRGKVSQFDIDVYNGSVYGIFRKFAEFVSMHYSLSLREDSLYWKDISNKTFSKDFSEYKISSVVGFQDLQNKKMFTHEIKPTDGITYISVGMNYNFFDRVDQKMNLHGSDIKFYIDSQIKFFNEKKKKWELASKAAPTLYKYLEENIHD